MAPRGLVKDADDEARFHCAGGVGILREEVWVNAAGEVVRYNLAFILPHIQRADHGRVLGYDNAHGDHERHFRGTPQPVNFTTYNALVRRFYREVQELRKEYENHDLP